MRYFARDGRLRRMLPSARTGTVLVAVLSVACALAALLLVLTVVRPVPPDVRTPEVQIGRSAPPTTSSVVPTPGSVLPPPPPGDDDEDD
ncbi:hypothetical protein SAMN04488074_104189 [Lentzea albidocapillata subsp. violacea]|uniref:Uncharacterized protein n=1 Tax=Lentzea albidocapillata subsp. violacea TaxID=128104 RepID=A0A1G8YZG2_9PSEU|nr:hypothetical protein [Lentzea albidocapillata]SDK07774.1 hypothetical protein SAMN04488074_104189 [Lentzea albidocapillata subsp. violacea]